MINKYANKSGAKSSGGTTYLTRDTTDMALADLNEKCGKLTALCHLKSKAYLSNNEDEILELSLHLKNPDFFNFKVNPFIAQSKSLIQLIQLKYRRVQILMSPTSCLFLNYQLYIATKMF
ncbi:uncharacterized protein LOC143303352 [Bombus vancouverensis nearcticus]|uniref:uncharacterized protein LOC143303352 n=1 Tax=Bombus vancouverensis nearcticus TaxID=2705178 RepID=UPI00402BD967